VLRVNEARLQSMEDEDYQVPLENKEKADA
jgi:hypothetical protein